LRGTFGWERVPGPGFRHAPDTPMGMRSRRGLARRIEPGDRGE
jgi:hypothetical protein